MVRKYVKLLDGNGSLVNVIDCDNRHCPETCLRKAEKRVKEIGDKKIQFMQFAMGRDSLTAKHILRPVRIS